MRDDKLESAIARGARAKELMDSEVLKDIFARIEADYIAGPHPARQPRHRRGAAQVQGRGKGDGRENSDAAGLS
jgi:hypothetical protein